MLIVWIRLIIKTCVLMLKYSFLEKHKYGDAIYRQKCLLLGYTFGWIANL